MYSDTVQSIPFPFPLNELSQLNHILYESDSKTYSTKTNKTIDDIPTDITTTRGIIKYISKCNSTDQLCAHILNTPTIIISNPDNFELTEVLDTICIYLYSKNEKLQLSCLKAFYELLSNMNSKTSSFSTLISTLPPILYHFLERTPRTQYIITDNMMQVITQIIERFTALPKTSSEDMRLLQDICHEISNDNNVSFTVQQDARSCYLKLTSSNPG